MNKIFIFFSMLFLFSAKLFPSQHHEIFQIFQIVNNSDYSIIYSYKYCDDIFREDPNVRLLFREYSNVRYLNVIEDGNIIGSIGTLWINPKPGIKSFLLYSETNNPNSNWKNLNPVINGLSRIDFSVVFYNQPSQRYNISFVQAIQRLFDFIIIFDYNGNVIMTFEDVLRDEVLNTRVINVTRSTYGYSIGYIYTLIITNETIKNGILMYEHLDKFSGIINNSDYE